MPASVFTAILSFQEILFRKNQISLIGIVIVALFKNNVVNFLHLPYSVRIAKILFLDDKWIG